MRRKLRGGSREETSEGSSDQREERSRLREKSRYIIEYNKKKERKPLKINVIKLFIKKRARLCLFHIHVCKYPSQSRLLCKRFYHLIFGIPPRVPYNVFLLLLSFGLSVSLRAAAISDFGSEIFLLRLSCRQKRRNLGTMRVSASLNWCAFGDISFTFIWRLWRLSFDSSDGKKYPRNFPAR